MTCRWLPIPVLAAGNLLENTQLLWATVALVAALLIAAFLLAWANRWRRNYTRPPMSAGEQLTAFRLSYERGEMSEEEFKRIKEQLTPKMRKEFDQRAGPGQAAPKQARPPASEMPNGPPAETPPA